ncbi:XdhC/CoxI family protein [Stenotrophomonas sp. PS02300]|uniref:XdhC family protein n=1 Tax=Stenotrophomonas sp. PS02300 TaxID=2991426 RepID=UPI00249BD098|nr:XdhC/CoxI family protein [Stenotrophomonas sp. PS02300]
MSAGLASTPLEAEDGNPGLVFKAALAALRDGRRAALAVVLETEGSTYTRAGTVVLFTDQGHVGWLSGGCLEPEIERRAMQAVDESALAWMEIDTRDDDALFAGNAVGCRGRQRVVLIPLASLAGIDSVFDPWLRGEGTLELRLHGDGVLQWRCGDTALSHDIASPPVDWEAPRREWQLQWRRAPGVVVLGAGPEAAPLLPLLVGLGWRVEIHEPRERWRERLAVIAPPDQRSGATGDSPASYTSRLRDGPLPDAVLVMHHNFELDREALEALASTSIPFIGLLGPARRRDDLFKLLRPEARAALSPRLRSPIGLALGGPGPEAIALSIAAQLQAWRHGVPGMS